MQVYRSAAVGQHKFEYLDHTADVQLHAWGSSLGEAFEQVGLAMFNYMTPIDELAADAACARDVSVSGHDLQSLLFSYLDELLFIYSTEYIMMKSIAVTSLDTEKFTVKATGHGEKFDRCRHECGTEVKAITYSAMQIRQQPGDAEVFVIVDI
ncbi:Archease domain-containing protein [Scenedesmus sp. NREL 46B-D3]|nr:Archease domain-containing protein [Scenedesmus sp. NREL 46B-D3]